MKSVYPLSSAFGCYAWGDLLETLPKRLLRCVAFAVLVFFTWAVLEPWKLAHADEAPRGRGSISQAAAPSSQQATEKIERTLRSLKRKVAQFGAPSQLAESAALTPKTESLDEDEQAIEAADADVLAQFAETEACLKAAGLPAEILNRHYKAVADYKASMKKLRGHLYSLRQMRRKIRAARPQGNNAQAASQSQAFEQELGELKAFLQEKVKEPLHTPLDPNNLPHRTPNVQKREPRQQKEEFVELQQLTQDTPRKDFYVLQAAQANSSAPTPDDLAETPEVQFTQAIRDLAAQLEHQPVKIYEYVRNNFDFEPTYGSIKGI